MNIYLETIVHLEKLFGNSKSKDVPEEYKKIKVSKTTRQLTFTNEFTILYHNSEYAERDMGYHTHFYLNRDLAIHSERVMLFLNKEIYRGMRTIDKKITEATISINSNKIDKLSQILRGYFNDPQLLESVLSGIQTDTKLVFNGNSKTLCKIFRYLHLKGILNNDVTTLQTWLIHSFEYISKGNPKPLNNSTVTRYLEDNLHSPPIAELAEL